MRKFAIPIIVLIAGFGISYRLYTGLQTNESEIAAAEFERRAANISSVLTNGIKGYSTAIEALKNITSVSLKNSDELNLDQPEDYRKLKEEWDGAKVFLNQMAKDAEVSFPGLLALGWVLPTPYSELKQLELAGKFLISPKFKIRQFQGDGLVEEIVELDEHFPIWYVEPMQQNEIGLGMDLASAGVTRDAVIEARDTGNTVSTEPINWIRDLTGQLGFLVFDAVYLNDEPMATTEERRANLHSVSYGAIHVDDMMKSSLRGLREEGLKFFVFPHAEEIESGSPSAAPVYSSDGRPESFEECRAAVAVSGFEQISVFDVLGRDWSLYSYPQPGFISRYQSKTPAVAFTTGILITLTLAMYLFQSARRTQRIQALVDERTRELSSSNENFEREMAVRIEADERRQELENQLLHTQKMESVGQLAGGVAHDFNNLLQAILGYGEMAMEKLESDTPEYGHVNQVMEAGERAKVLVSQLLAFSRQQVLNLSDVDLDKVMDDLIQMIRRVIGEHITLDVISAGDLGIVRADRGQLEQILVNLCVNARDAMGEGGTLTIETSNIQLDDSFCNTHTGAKPGKYVLLSVADTGCGMDEDVIQRIFEPFFTTKELGKGTGLGLSTVFGIVRQHNGVIDVQSEIDSGTIFGIYLPTVEATDTQPFEAPTNFSKGGTETILLADDEELVRDVAETMLRKAGYKVLMAVDGDDAIQLFDEHVETIDMALLDVVMPRVGGKVVADHILKRRPNIPILFCSGYRSDSIHTNFIQDDQLELLPKPYRRSDLLLKVREVIDNAKQ